MTQLVTIMTGTKADCVSMSERMGLSIIQPGQSNADANPNGQWELLGPGDASANNSEAIRVIDLVLAALRDASNTIDQFSAREPDDPRPYQDAIEAGTRLRAQVRALQADRAEAIGVVSILHAALDDASSVVDPGEDEEYAYQAELEAGKRLLDRVNRQAGEPEVHQQPITETGAQIKLDPHALFVERIAGLKKWGEPDEDGEPFEPSDGLDDSHSCLMDLIDEARDLRKHAEQHNESDQTRRRSARIADVNLLDVVGDYDTPDDVEEWRWIRSVASFAHRGNGTEPGVFEFIINLARDLENIPRRLVSIIDAARRDGADYALFHQG